MIDATPRRRPSASPRRRSAALLLAALLTLLLAPAATATVGTPAPATTVAPSATTTAGAMADSILTWLNRDRAAVGLRPLLAWPGLQTLANQRSAKMASSHVLSHTAAGGNPGTAITNAGLQNYSWGEIIGETSYPWGTQAAANLYRMWRGSPIHHAEMFSSTYNYIGIGIARAADGTTWSSTLFTESADHTRPVAYNGSLSASGTTIVFHWSGRDPVLQTHTAGLRAFNVQFHVTGTGWYTIRYMTTSTYLVLTNRRRGLGYYFRVQAVDRRGNLSPWTAVKGIYLP